MIRNTLKNTAFKKIPYRIFSGLLVLCLLLTSSIHPAYAQQANKDVKYTPQPIDCSDEAKAKRAALYKSYGIEYYEPCSSPTCTQEEVDGVLTTLVGDNNRDRIINYFITRGLSADQSAGIASSLQAVSGFNPFHQEKSQTWPNGGYGIAHFKDDQRTDISAALKTALGDTDFATYYVETYGGDTTEATGFVPASITDEVNDKVLSTELEYLYKYMTEYTPDTNKDRVTALSTDYDIKAADSIKLLDFIKSLSSASDVAKAWTYLYEVPDNVKSAAAERATVAESLLAAFSTNAELTEATEESCGVVGSGGLTYEQAQAFIKFYQSDHLSFLSGVWTTKYTDQCTTFIVYFNNRFVVQGSGNGNGVDVVPNLLNEFPNSYKSVDKTGVQPFTVFSSSNSGDGQPGHTGIILGIGSDGSVVIGEANAGGYLVAGRTPGLLEKESFGAKNTTLGIASVERWESIDAWINNAASERPPLTNPTFAAPVDLSTVSAAVQKSLAELAGVQ